MKTYCLTYLALASGRSPFILYEVKKEGDDKGKVIHAFERTKKWPVSFHFNFIHSMHQEGLKMPDALKIPDFFKRHFTIEDKTDPLQHIMELYPEDFL